MNPDASSSALSNSDPHERARMLIAFSGPASPSPAGSPEAELSNADQSWLAAHLDSCPACYKFAENARETIRSMRGIPVTAGSSLVIKTQMRVRQGAARLQQQQERLWIICACCAAVTLCSAVTTAVLWQGFAWAGREAGFPAPIWQGGFALFYLLPAVLAGIFLLSRGTFLADHNTTHENWPANPGQLS